MHIIIIFPTQLFPIEYYKDISDQNTTFVLIEHNYFFKKFSYHKLKLAFHRATMKSYYDQLLSKFDNVLYIDNEHHSKFQEKLKSAQTVKLYNPIEKELFKLFKPYKTKTTIYESPYFLNSHQDNVDINNNLSSIRHDIFYKNQRLKYEMLLDNKKPLYNKWSFDTENRLKFPKEQEEPEIPKLKNNDYIQEAFEYVNKQFSKHYGNLIELPYPINRKSALKWLDHFIEHKLNNFGKYEDALDKHIIFGYHSVLSPMLNTGILIPLDIIEKLKELKINKNNIASIEGFTRQVIGWREYCYFIYDIYGKYLEKNFFYNKNKRKIPIKIWKGTTTIPYVDAIIEKVNNTAYCHHIERLMGMSNYMNLLNIHPKEIYKWFMTMFIDGYDVFMVPNVYGMALYGFINTKDHMMVKPYISSSNYILKMSHYKKGVWCDVIDALYYEFIKDNSDKFKHIYALSPAVSRYNKFSKERKLEMSKIKKQHL